MYDQRSTGGHHEQCMGLCQSLLQRQINMDIRWYKSWGLGAGRAIELVSSDFIVTGKSLTMTVTCTMAQLSLDRKYKLSSKFNIGLILVWSPHNAAQSVVVRLHW